MHNSGNSNYAASDSADLTLIVTVPNTAPTVTISNVDPAIVSGNVEGNTTGGANVSFDVTVTDTEDDPDPAATCTDQDDNPVDPTGTFFALDGTYTVFGKVVGGLAVLVRITQGEQIRTIRMN